MSGFQRGDDTPVLITEAEPSYDDQQAARRKKYALMMSLRIPCLIAAVMVYPVWWLSLIIVAVSIPLPWIAVLVANDRPPRKSEHVSRFQGEPDTREIDDPQHRVVDSP
ncbi:putative membrane protein [Actinopolyspora biskrensis]|uniref:Putative membrane protein n=1 Tax=Actinopolyspora biskrensis TaxID=1470178 RepID=A0A852YNB7_9ACTN|nr:putative membrane protein [Actinopolyspora biskrensis]